MIVSVCNYEPSDRDLKELIVVETLENAIWGSSAVSTKTLAQQIVGLLESDEPTTSLRKYAGSAQKPRIRVPAISEA